MMVYKLFLCLFVKYLEMRLCYFFGFIWYLNEYMALDNVR